MTEQTNAHTAPRYLRPTLWLLAAVLGLVLGLLVRSHVAGPRYADDPVLNRAARTLLYEDTRRTPTVAVQMERRLELPALESFLTPERMAALAVELRCLPPAEAETAADRLREGLKVDRPRGLLLLRVLDLHRPAPPGPLADLASAERSRAMQAAREAVAWPAARQELTEHYGLSPEQAFAVRVALCRQPLQEAFRTRDGADTAARALGKYAGLSSAQARGLLRLAAALRLLEAGPAADPAVRAIGRTHPQLAALLRSGRR